MEAVSNEEESKSDFNDRVFFSEGNLPIAQQDATGLKKSGKFGKVSTIEQRGNFSSLPNFSSLFTHSYRIDAKIFQNQQIYLEGWLKKRSRYLKKWRNRWVVLTDKYLYTFKKKRRYRNPTEKLDIKECEAPQCADQYLRKANTIRVYESHKNTTFYFRADDPFEKHKFVEALKFIVMISSGAIKLEEDENI